MSREFVYTHKDKEDVDDIHIHASNKEAASYKLELIVKKPGEWVYSHEVKNKPEMA